MRAQAFSIRFLILLLTLSVAQAAWGQEYKIKLNRSEKVGDTYSISGSGKSANDLTITPEGVPPQKQQQKFAAELEGTVKVVAVDNDGQATEMACTIGKLTRDGQSVLDKGTVVNVATVGGKHQATVNGQPVDPPVAEALDLFLSPHKPGDPNDDVVFGTTKPQKVGDTWAVNSEAAAKSLTEGGGPKLAPEDIKGTGTLVAVKKIDGKDYLQVDVEISVDNIKGPLPGAGNIDKGKLSAKFSALVDAAATGERAQESQTLDMKLTVKAQTPDNKSVTVDINGNRHEEAKFSPAK